MTKPRCPICNKKLKKKYSFGISCEGYRLYICPRCLTTCSGTKRVKDSELSREYI